MSESKRIGYNNLQIRVKAQTILLCYTEYLIMMLFYFFLDMLFYIIKRYWAYLLFKYSGTNIIYKFNCLINSQCGVFKT